MFTQVSKRTTIPFVTSHAIIRWLERVEGRDLTLHRQSVAEVYGDVNQRALVRLLRADGFDIQAVERAILTPLVVDAILSGATRITLPCGTIELRFRGQAVVTVATTAERGSIEHRNVRAKIRRHRQRLRQRGAPMREYREYAVSGRRARRFGRLSEDAL